MIKKFFSLTLLSCFLSVAAIAETVVYNVKTGKYHKPSCQAAVKCTINCIKIEKSQAKQKGGVACKLCGG